MELAKVSPNLSLSTLLSPAASVLDANEAPTSLTIGGRPLDSTYLVLLALNEECRSTGQGAFYHLPLRGGHHAAHACDLIYLPDAWNSYDDKSWDEANWAERLEMCSMKGKIQVNEDVLPLCVRILQFVDDLTGPGSLTSRRESFDSGYGSRQSTSSGPHSSPDSIAVDCFSTQIRQPLIGSLTTQRDPSIQPNSYCYSRPMEDVSSYLVLYPSHHSSPILCPTAAFEHASLCDRHPTPGDFSETFSYGLNNKQGVATPLRLRSVGEKAEEEIGNIAAQHVMVSGMSSNRELVDRLWEIWHAPLTEKGELERDWLGRIKYSWQEIKSIDDGGRFGGRQLPQGWPTKE